MINREWAYDKIERNQWLSIAKRRVVYINPNHIHNICFITIVKENVGNHVEIDML